MIPEAPTRELVIPAPSVRIYQYYPGGTENAKGASFTFSG